MRFSHLFIILAALFIIRIGAAQQSSGINEQEGQKVLSLTVQSAAVKGALPLTDPMSKAWGQAKEVTVKMTPQTAQEPKLAKASIGTVRVRALRNDGWVAFRLDWADPSESNTMRSDKFGDAAAVEFPMKANPLPDYRMGSEDKPVHLLLWRADRQWAKQSGKTFLERNYPRAHSDTYPFTPRAGDDKAANQPERDQYLAAKAAGNPIVPGIAPIIEELNAATWNQLSVQTHQDARGVGVYKNGRWYVVFARPITTADANDAPLPSGSPGLVAFAVWDGGSENAHSRKMVSEGWLRLKMK